MANWSARRVHVSNSGERHQWVVTLSPFSLGEYVNNIGGPGLIIVIGRRNERSDLESPILATLSFSARKIPVLFTGWAYDVQ